MSSSPQRWKILMIAGAGFTGGLICRFSKYLKETGRYEVFGLGVENSIGRKADVLPSEVFAGSAPWPELPPRNLVGAFHLLHGLLFGPKVAIPIYNASLKKRIAERISWSWYARGMTDMPVGYDLYHWHCFHPHRLPLLQFLPDNARIVVSLWGSDLYRTSGTEEYIRQVEACRRASVLTVGSLEMRETFLAKFGRQWQDKMRIVNYGADNLDVVDCARRDPKLFRRRLGISPDSVVIVVGNNASKINRHIEVLNSIATALCMQDLARITILLPMTYGQEPEYVQTMKKVAREHPARVLVLEQYLSELEVGHLRSSVDITVHVPISDQFSAAMCEALYAGSVVITGAWLPYSCLRLNRVHYHEISGPAEVGEKIRGILSTLQTEKQQAAKAAPVIRQLVSWDRAIERFEQIYNELLH